MTTTTRSRRTRFIAPMAIVLAGLAGSASLATSFSPTMSAFVASITNSANTKGAGYLTMQESNSDGSVLCNSTDGGSINTNTATCATINKYSGYALDTPGHSNTTDVIIKNTGTVTATSFALAPGACTQSSNNATQSGSAKDLCAKMNVVVTSGGTTVFSGTAASLAAGGSIDLVAKLGSSVAAGASVPFRFVVSLDSSADNTYEGLSVSQPLVWSFGA